MNTFTVHVEDLSGPEKYRAILFRHEGYQLWEQQVFGFTVGAKFYVQLSNTGMKVISLGS